MIIDMRCRPPAEQYLAYFRGMIAPEKRPLAHREGSMEQFFKEMKEAGITQAVASGGSNPGLKLGDKVIPPREITNEHVSEVQSKYADRIIGVGGIDPSGRYHDPIKEIEKCKKLGLKGVFMEPGRSLPGCRLDDSRLYPVYQRCSELGLFINPQTSGPLGGDNIDYANPKYIDHVAEDFPNLTIICCHGCYPYVMQIVVVTLRRENVYASPDIYIMHMGTSLWVDAINSPANFGKGTFADKLLFGTAYPYVELKVYAEFFKKLPISDEAREKIYYKNAIKAMKLDTSKYPTSW